VGIEKPIALSHVVLARYNKKMASVEEIVSRYDRNQKDANVMVSGEVTNSAILVRQQVEEEETALRIR
jgi:hypothetical protein